jgi:hypothetical protein
MCFIKDLIKDGFKSWLALLLTALGVTSLIGYFNKWVSNKIYTYFNWLLNTDIYANWLVTLLILLNVSLSVWLLVIFYKRINSGKAPKWLRYQTDVIWKVKWTWIYGSSYDYKEIYDLNPTCPQCRGDVRLKEGYESRNVLTVVCQGCNSQIDKLNGTKYGYEEAVKAEIRKNIRQRYHVD